MGFLNNLLLIVLLFTALFLIVLILIQRGKGGGLAGAFGGMGGQSAFGTKAGDTFTKITIGVAIFWILLCIALVKMTGGTGGGPLSEDMGGADQKPGISASIPADQKPGDKSEAPADKPADKPADTPAPSEEKPQS